MRRQVWWLIVPLLLAGCTLAPKYERSTGEVPEEYRFQSLKGQPEPLLRSLADLSWWEIFDDRELQNLIRTALEQNYDVQLAAARVAEARALVGVSRSLWLPQVGGAYAFQRQRLSQVSFPPLPRGTPHTGNINQLSLDLFWEIDLFGRLRSLTEAARAEFFPRLSLTGLFGRQSLALSDLFTGPAKIWSIGPAVTLPIFTGGRNYFTLQTTRAQREQALVLYQFTVRQAFREVADGLIGHAQLADLRREQEALVKSNLDYAQLANLRYKGGLESFLAVLDADRQLFATQLDLAAVQRDQLFTLVQLYKALGGGWENREPPRATAAPASGPAKRAEN